MRKSRIVLLWMCAIACRIQGHSLEKQQVPKASGEVQEFFNQIESVMDKLVDDSKQPRVRQVDARRQGYSVPVEKMPYREAAASEFSRNLAPDYDSRAVHNLDGTQRNGALEFEGYQDFVFRPLYPCDRFDAVRRQCVLFRQLGTTLTLGVQMGDSPRRGVRILWYRYLKKQQFDHYIREALNREFLPWNLNLGGSQSELRISPLTETDLSYNYFVAELDFPRTYRQRYEQRRPTIRFSIEPIHIDMGTLYHGEEIIIYARSFMELPQTSVNFAWSLYDSKDFEDHGLPSNMRLTLDRSCVIIKELKTYQSQILTCSVYSNKNVFLARRNFLFRGIANEDSASSDKSNISRQKRSYDNVEELDEERDQEKLLNTESSSNTDMKNTESLSNILSGFQNILRITTVPEISKELFYDGGKNEYYEETPYSRFQRSDRMSPFSSQVFNPSKVPAPQEISRFNSFSDSEYPSRSELSPFSNQVSNTGKLFPPRDMSGFNSMSDSEYPPAIEDDVTIKSHPQIEPLRFEDKESQTIATCSSNRDCNAHASCIRASYSGQKFCKCLHGYNGNGIFCFSN